MDFIRSSEEAAQSLVKVAFYHLTVRADYIEMMSAAYMRMTDIDPREIELVERRWSDGMISWYFRKREVGDGV